LTSTAAAAAKLSNGGTPTGTVTFKNGANTLGTETLANGGRITLGTGFSGIGGNASIWIYRARAFRAVLIRPSRLPWARGGFFRLSQPG
jgi:hypothetical protein